MHTIYSFLHMHSSSYAETLKINFWDEYVVSALGIKLFLLELGERMKTPQKYINGPSKSTQASCVCLPAQFSTNASVFTVILIFLLLAQAWNILTIQSSVQSVAFGPFNIPWLCPIRFYLTYNK